MENRWLPVVQRLAREVDVEDYIHDIDHPQGGRGSCAGARWRQARQFLFGAFVGALALFTALCIFGYRIVGPQQQRLIDAVYRVDSNPGRWTDPQLILRLTIRREVMELLEHAVAAPPSSDVYPYAADLTGHPPALVDPGRGAALIMLATAIDQVPRDQRGLLVDRVVSIGAALGDPDFLEALRILSALDGTVRRELFANGARGLTRIVSAQKELEQAGAKKATLQEQLTELQKAMQQQSDNIVRQIGPTQAWIAALGRIDQQCRRASNELSSCMNAARQRLQR